MRNKKWWTSNAHLCIYFTAGKYHTLPSILLYSKTFASVQWKEKEGKGTVAPVHTTKAYRREGVASLILTAALVSGIGITWVGRYNGTWTPNCSSHTLDIIPTTLSRLLHNEWGYSQYRNTLSLHCLVGFLRLVVSAHLVWWFGSSRLLYYVTQLNRSTLKEHGAIIFNTYEGQSVLNS